MKATIAEIEPRIKVSEVKLNDNTIIRYDVDNAYPQRIERYIDGSVTAKNSAKMLSAFLRGRGFESVDFSKLTVNRSFERVWNILSKVSRDSSRLNGLALHLNYNAVFEISEVRHIPFSNARLKKSDDTGYVGKVVLYDNWEREKGRKYNQNDVRVYDVFNPDKEVVAAQVEKAGGWDKYRGQILWHSFDESPGYPLSPLDPVILEADNEYLMSQFKNNKLNKGFMADFILFYAQEPQGFPSDIQDGDNSGSGRMSGSEDGDLVESIKQFQSTENAGSILAVQVDGLGEDGDVSKSFKLEKIDPNINDKIFQVWKQEAANDIRKAFDNIPPVLVDYVQGKLGNTSGEEFRAAVDFYNEMTREKREAISYIFEEVFSRFHEKINGVSYEILPTRIGNGSDNTGD